MSDAQLAPGHRRNNPIPTRTVATQCDLPIAAVVGEWEGSQQYRVSPWAKKDHGTSPERVRQQGAGEELLALLGEADRVASHGISLIAERRPSSSGATATLVDAAMSAETGVLDVNRSDDNPFGPQCLNDALLGCDDASMSIRTSTSVSPSNALDGDDIGVVPSHPPRGSAAPIPTLSIANMKHAASSCSLGSWAVVFTPRTPTHPTSMHQHAGAIEAAHDGLGQVAPSPLRSVPSDTMLSTSAVSSPLSSIWHDAQPMVRRHRYSHLPSAPVLEDCRGAQVHPAQPHPSDLGAISNGHACVAKGRRGQHSSTPPLTPQRPPVAGGMTQRHASSTSSTNGHRSTSSASNHTPRSPQVPPFACALFLDGRDAQDNAIPSACGDAGGSGCRAVLLLTTSLHRLLQCSCFRVVRQVVIDAVGSPVYHRAVVRIRARARSAVRRTVDLVSEVCPRIPIAYDALTMLSRNTVTAAFSWLMWSPLHGVKGIRILL